MSAAGALALPGVVEALARELRDGLEQAIASRARTLYGDDERRFHEPADQLERAGTVPVEAHGCDSLEREPAREHRQLPEQLPLLVGEEAVAPVDGRPEGLVPCVGHAAPRTKEAHAVVESIGDLPDREHLGVGGRELDREREAVELAADLRHGGQPIRVDGEIAPDRVAAVEKEARARVPLDLVRLCGLVGGRERLEREVELAGDAQRDAARCQHADVRALSENLVRKRGAPRCHVLAVVEDQQELPPGELVDEGVEERDVDASPTPTIRATAAGTSAGSDNGIRSTSQVPFDHASTWRDAASSASLVLPEPPVPVNVTSRCSRSRLFELGKLASATDEARHLSGNVVLHRHRGRGGHLVPQHGSLEPAELLARLEPELLVKKRLRPSVGGERVRLAPAPVQSDHELPPESLAQRLLGDEALELGDELCVPTESELCLDQLLAGDEAELVQALRLGGEHSFVAYVGERGSAPEPERRPEPVAGKARRSAGERITTVSQESLELRRID